MQKKPDVRKKYSMQSFEGINGDKYATIERGPHIKHAIRVDSPKSLSQIGDAVPIHSDMYRRELVLGNTVRMIYTDHYVSGHRLYICGWTIRLGLFKYFRS